MLPERTRHLAFGDVAAAWGILQDLGVAAVIDEVTGTRSSDAGASTGTYLALAALNRLVAPCSKAGFADWWKTTAADRFTKVPVSVLDHRRFWDAMQAVTLEQMEEISRQIAVRIVQASGADCSSVALDMTSPETRARPGAGGGNRPGFPPPASSGRVEAAKAHAGGRARTPAREVRPHCSRQSPLTEQLSVR